MATFRKYGGTNFSPISNIVRHNILNSKSSSFNTSGLYNTKETYLSHIDMSGNSLIHVGNVIFQDGTSMSSAQNINPGLSDVLTNGPSAGNKSMTNVGSIGYSSGSNQTSAYTGYMTQGTYNYATLTLDSNGKITNIVSNTTTAGGLSQVLSASGNGGGLSMTNLGSIEQTTGTTSLLATVFDGNITQSSVSSSNTLKATVFDGNISQSSGSNTLNSTEFDGNITQNGDYEIISQSGSGVNILKETTFNGNINLNNNIKFSNGKLQNTSYTGFIPSLSKSVYRNTTITFDITNGQIVDVSDNKVSVGLEDVLTTSGDGGTKPMTNLGDITQASNYIITQSGSGTNNLKATQFSGNIEQTSNYIYQSGIETNKNTLKGTIFNEICSYVSSVGNFTTNDIPNKAYVDSVAAGLRPTTSCKCATTMNVPLSSISVGFQVDGYNVLDGDRVLVKSQGGINNENTNNVYNGIYVYNTSSANLTRASDCDSEDNITNQISLVENGTLNGSSAFVQINSITNFVPNTDEVKYIKFSPMKLDFQLGNGLEVLESTTPKTLQVKSILNFLTNVSINGPLSMTGDLTMTGGILDINNSGGSSNPLMKMKYSNSDRLKYFTNLTGGNFNGIIQTGDSAMIIYNNPLSIAYDNTLITSGIRIGSDNIKLHSNATNYYNLNTTTGHDFYGNCNFNDTVTFIDNISANGATISPLELSFLDGVSSNIQDQINSKASLGGNNTFTGTTNIFENPVTFNSSIKLLNNITISNVELSYLSGTTSNIQTQLNDKVSSSGNNTFSGTNTFSGYVNLNGNNYVNGDIIANGATITSTELSFLDGVSSNIQGQLNGKVSPSGNNTFSGTNTFNNNVTFNNQATFTANDNNFNASVNFNSTSAFKVGVSFSGKNTRSYNVSAALGFLQSGSDTIISTGDGTTLYTIFSNLSGYSTYILFFDIVIKYYSGDGNDQTCTKYIIEIYAASSLLNTFDYGSLTYKKRTDGLLTTYSSSCYIYNQINNSNYDIQMKFDTKVSSGLWLFGIKNPKIVRIS